MPAGERKIPEPIVDPMTTAMALQSPMRRSRVPALGAPGEAVGSAIRKCYRLGRRCASFQSSTLRTFVPVHTGAVATQLADILFYVIAALIAVSQAFILRSTARGMSHGPDATAEPSRTGVTPAPRNTALEWTYAIVPAIALALLLVAAWRTMHPATLQVEGVTPPATIGT